MSSKFNLKQVAEKSTDTSGLIVIDKRVYDITDYMSKHPYVYLPLMLRPETNLSFL